MFYWQGESNDDAYFITSNAASVVVPMRNGDNLEAAFVGLEDVAAKMQLLGIAKAHTTRMAQLDMTALKISLNNLATMFRTSEAIGRYL